MKILALIGSSRHLGNTELMVTEVAKSAAHEFPQIQVELLRLTELRLGYCNGCMSCALAEPSPCPLDDDMGFLMQQLEACDGLIVGAPAYTLLPPGPLKLIADRLILQLSQRKWQAPKPAVTVGVAGLQRWSEILVPLLNCMILAQGFKPVDAFLAYGAGPGEVLLDPQNPLRARSAGERLGHALCGDPLPAPVPSGCCPICGADFFRITHTGIECPLCLVPGRLEGNRAVFEAEPSHRWEADAMRQHFTDWIQASGERYLERRPAIRKLLRQYRPSPFPFIKPRSA